MAAVAGSAAASPSQASGTHDMGMIQGIDGSALLAAFRQGRSDRATDDKAKAEAERQKKIGGLMGQLFGERQPASGGVAGQYAHGGIVATPEQEAESARIAARLPNAPKYGAETGMTFGQAFSPQAMETIGSQPSAPPAPVSAPTMGNPSRRPDPNVLAQLIALDPETGGKIASAFKTMDESQLKKIEARNSHMGAAARYVQQGRTPEERQQRFQIAVPSLLEAGYTPQELDGIDNDLSDQRLQFYQATAIDYDKMIDNELAEREFLAGKNVPVVPGGNVANIKPDGTARWVIGGGGAPTNAPAVSSSIPPDAAAALKRGEGSPEQFDAIFGPGSAARIMGGGAGNSAGGFPQ
jgi:hypothetical protein